MRCEILGADVGFGFHDARPVFPVTHAMDEDRPDQVPSKFFCILTKE
jgi:hypothetical protein